MQLRMRLMCDLGCVWCAGARVQDFPQVEAKGPRSAGAQADHQRSDEGVLARDPQKVHEELRRRGSPRLFPQPPCAVKFHFAKSRVDFLLSVQSGHQQAVASECLRIDVGECARAVPVGCSRRARERLLWGHQRTLSTWVFHLLFHGHSAGPLQPPRTP